MNQQDRIEETGHLVRTLQEIDTQLAHRLDIRQDAQTELSQTLQDYWDDFAKNAVDEAQAVEAVNRQRSLSGLMAQRYRQLEHLRHSPYFGRIDFKEDLESRELPPEAIYIGISTLTGKAGEIMIYDWRTPVAGMFYDFERGPAWYSCPAGRIGGVISLKRQYKITDGQIRYMFDSDLKIDDEMLQQILGSSADAKMHTIITSIQREQNKIIRDEVHRILFVEGPAGSGKTSVALHRVAYLLYRDRATVTSRNVLILSPNPIFSEYISTVLPEIGEENVPRLTFQDYCDRMKSEQDPAMESRNDMLEKLLSSGKDREYQSRTAGMRYKSSDEFASVIQHYVAFLAEHLVDSYPAVEYKGETIFSQTDWQSYYRDRFAFLPPLRRLTKIRELIQLRLRPIVRKLRQKKINEITQQAEEVNETTILALARIAVRNDLHKLRENVERLTGPDPFALYRALFASGTEANERFVKAALLPPDWENIRRFTADELKKNQLYYEDSLPYLYLRGMLNGFASRPEVKHLVIDESQDYTKLHYLILAKIFPNCTWTILGDPAQTLQPDLKRADFGVAADILAAESSGCILLNRSYRSTQAIQEFCRRLLPGLPPYEGVNRPGPLPLLLQGETHPATHTLLFHCIRQWQAEGWQSIAIVGKNAEACRDIYLEIKPALPVSLIIREDDPFCPGISIIASYLTKGLEFDCVLALDTDRSSYGSSEERGLLYTVCTRALHRLALIYSGEPSPFLASVPPALYQGTDLMSPEKE